MYITSSIFVYLCMYIYVLLFNVVRNLLSSSPNPWHPKPHLFAKEAHQVPWGKVSIVFSWRTKTLEVDLGVSENDGTPQIIHFNRGFHYKPSILGYPCFRKHPLLGCPRKLYIWPWIKPHHQYLDPAGMVPSVAASSETRKCFLGTNLQPWYNG